VAVGVLALGLFLGELEAVAMDWMMRLAATAGAAPEPDPRIVLCDLDEESLDRLGGWPWPRARVAALVDALAEAGASLIVLDITFAEPSRDGPGDDEALAAALTRAGNGVLGYYFRDIPTAGDSGGYWGNAGFDVVDPGTGFPAIPLWPAVEPNLEPLAHAAAGQGFFSTERPRSLGSDVLRHYPLVVRHGASYFPALGLMAAARFEGTLLELRPRLRHVPQILLGERPVEHDAGGQLWIRYRGNPATGAPRYRTLSAAAVLEDRDAGDLTGKLVFVGASAVRLGDLYNTPFGVRIPGVESHAQVADNLLNGDFIHDRAEQKLVSQGVLLLLALGIPLLVISSRHYLTASLLAMVLVLLWPVAAFAAFITVGWHLHTVPPVFAGVAALLAALRYQVGRVEARKRQIEHTFRHYLSESVVREMLAHPERLTLKGEERELTVLFSDVSGFTTMAERLTSEEVVEILNQLFTPLTALVLREGGTFDKYMGDCLMAFFGAPVPQEDHAPRACRAALAMAAALPALNERWQARGLGTLALGIGLNSGPMTVGNMGSETIFDYTVIGDNVNLGSRVEGLTRLYGVPILVTAATAKAAGDPGGAFLFRELDRVQVKGKAEPVTILELMAERAALSPDEMARLDALRTSFARGLDAYRDRRFAEGAERFEALLAEHPGDGPGALLLRRCRDLVAHPPPDDWEPVERRATK
jgi:adenylate cyclase